MKRCPQCNRVENDEALKFCRVDGATLVSESSSLGGEAGTAQLVQDASEVHTSILPHRTDADMSRATGPTTSLRVRPPITTGSLPKPRSRKPIIIALVASALFVAVISVIIIGAYFYRARQTSAAIDSIAVLPFENKSNDAEAEYLSDGLAESLIYRLSQVPNLKVSPASSVMRYKGKEFDAQKIAADLGVRAVMSGRLIQRGDNLTISVELIDVVNNKTIWGEQYERKMSDLLATQREMATAIAEKLQLKLSGEEAKGLTKKYTESSEAYQLYLKGRFQWNKRTGESLKQSVEFYNQAIEKDPSFALAYAGIAESYVLFSNYDVALPKASMPQAKAAALRALELDDSLAEAHTALGWYRLSYEYDWIGGERALRRAIELNPNYATAHQWLGQLLMQAKRFDEGQAETKRALEADPLSPIVRFNLGYNLYLARQYDEALKEFQNTINLYPNFPLMPSGLCWAAYAKGAVDQAIPACRKALESVPDAYNTGYLALVLGRSGQLEEARKLFEQLKAEATRREVPSMAFALAHLGLNQKEEALAMFEKEVNEHGYWATSLTVLPELDELRNDSRFKALLRRMNSPG